MRHAGERGRGQTTTSSKDQTATLVGVWVPVEEQPLQTLSLRNDGVVIQVVSRGSARAQNVGTWSIVPPSSLFFALPSARGMGVPIARYSYTATDDRLTLKWDPDRKPLNDSQNWIPWIAGSDHPVVVLRKQ